MSNGNREVFGTSPKISFRCCVHNSCKVFPRSGPPQNRIGESWEIVDRSEAQSVVAGGPLRGKTLHELWTQHRKEIFGDVPNTSRFPLLIKILDAQEKLSLQVHPPENVASRLGGEPKSEFW